MKPLVVICIVCGRHTKDCDCAFYRKVNLRKYATAVIDSEAIEAAKKDKNRFYSLAVEQLKKCGQR